ncbi:SPFH domain-containing protein [Aquipuribacter hungaricus]|uniref:SPFH domain-containing protein n=1 Tax=Aquipuribacter hungaricus TaxID=545624 RepID=A0ABV7WD21_9MICO
MVTTTIDPGTFGVLRVDGATVGVLAPGRHRLPMAWRPWRRDVVRVDSRRSVVVVSGQEVASADVPGIKVSAAFTWQVVDPVRYLDASADPVDEVRLAVQVAVRDWAAASTLEELLAGRGAAGARLVPAVQAAGHDVGVQVREVVVRDVVVPVEVRRAAVAALTAQLEGRATVERARAETAALRSLANAGRLLADNPGLLQLRTVEAAASGGASVVVHLGTPVQGLTAST